METSPSIEEQQVEECKNYAREATQSGWIWESYEREAGPEIDTLFFSEYAWDYDTYTLEPGTVTFEFTAGTTDVLGAEYDSGWGATIDVFKDQVPEVALDYVVGKIECMEPQELEALLKTKNITPQESGDLRIREAVIQNLSSS